VDCQATDRCLLYRLKRSLNELGYARHRTLEVSVEQSVVKLQGKVPTFHLRQLAIACVLRVTGGCQLVDSIDVEDDRPHHQTNDIDHGELDSSLLLAHPCAAWPDGPKNSAIVPPLLFIQQLVSS
jgi:osmotically-inducible protein OsmY